jgi:hypothetical protein
MLITMYSAITLDYMLTHVHISGGDSSTKVYEDTELLWTFRPEAGKSLAVANFNYLRAIV